MPHARHRRLMHAALCGLVVAGMSLIPAAPAEAQPTPDPAGAASPTTDTHDPFAAAPPGQRPAVFINGMEVVTKQRRLREMTEEMYQKLPESLQTPNVRLALENRQKIRFYDHNPATGPEGAPITMVEFTDLSCIQCQDILRQADVVRNKYRDHIRHIHIHLPVDLYNATNPAAFYGRLAHHAGVFWDYRMRLFDVETIDDRTYANKLLEAGVNIRNLRELIRDNARRFYRELDADTILAKRMGETRPPVLFVNGIRVGAGIPIEHLEDLVKFELEIMSPSAALKRPQS